MSYDFKIIDKKWQNFWKEHDTFKTDVWDFSKPKFYALDMFPYPSGVGLHVGHPEGYTATDIVSRMKRMQGFNVLHPMGYDSFGLPAEQYAISTGHHPNEFTVKNVAFFQNQLEELGFDYDWSKVLLTSDPKYYHWTQWIFKQLYNDGYAKYVDMPVNWCEELGTVLSNDEVIDGKSERGGYPVVRKNMKQWVIDQPKFAEELLEGLNRIDWPESTKEIQRNWIGKSIGALVTFKVDGTDKSFTVFTTRCDTLFGATYCVLSPEHEIVKSIASKEQLPSVEAYIRQAASKSELERTSLNKDKTGVFLGCYAINPVNDKKIPLIKSRSDWVTKLESIMDMNSAMSEGRNKNSDGLDYKGFLRLLLLLRDSDTRNKRFMDLVEMRLRNTEGNKHFRMDGCVDAFKSEVTISGSDGSIVTITSVCDYMSR